MTEQDLLRIGNQNYQRAKDARKDRLDRNRNNWKALQGDFPWLQRKSAGQSREVLASLAMGLEQIAATLSRQLVTFRNWFSAESGPMDVALPPDIQQAVGDLSLLNGDDAARMLRAAMERLYVPGNAIETLATPRQLIYLAIKLGLVESEVVYKVSGMHTMRQVFMLDTDAAAEHLPAYEPYRVPGTPLLRAPVPDFRLKVDLVPFEDFYPDPSPGDQFTIHEVTLHRCELAQYGYDAARIAQVQQWLDGETEAAKRDRSGDVNTPAEQDRNTVRLREHWGNIVDPDTGVVLAENVMWVQVGNVVLQTPQPNGWWHGRRPFVRVPLMPVPMATTHPAFFDFAVPLFSTECELTNLVMDGGFAAVHGIKEIDEWKLANPEVLANGLVPGITLKTNESTNDGKPAVRRVDTGSLNQEVLDVLDRITRSRQEAMAINDLDLGRFPSRAVKATEVVQVQEASNTLFSEIGLRIEDGLESVLELCWLTLWQGLDAPLPPWITRELDPKVREFVENLTAYQRFALIANGTKFRVAGLQQTQHRVEEFQKQQTFTREVFGNPVLFQVWAQDNSPKKFLATLQRAIGIDPMDTKRDPDEPPLDPALLQGLAGNPQTAGNPALNPEGASLQGQMAPTNPAGDRGAQLM